MVVVLSSIPTYKTGAIHKYDIGDVVKIKNYKMKGGYVYAMISRSPKTKNGLTTNSGKSLRWLTKKEASRHA
jgi:hypothetical protein